MERISAVIVSTQQAWHGGESQALLLAQGLRERGHEVAAIASRGGAFAVRMAREGFPVAAFSGRGRTPFAVWQVRRRLLEWWPDLLLYNDAHALTAAGTASLGLSIPARVAVRRVDFPIHHLTRYRHYCDRVICVSRAVAKVCRQSGLEQERLALVHDGVSPERIRSGERRRGRSALGLAEGQPLLLTVAKLTDHKGHRFLLGAMPEIVAAHPKVVLALAGDGELAEPLAAQAKQLGVAENVRFLGFRNDVPDLMMAADLFVLPSHLEGLCTSVIDAMLACRPIVATSAGGIPDLLGYDPAAEGPVAKLVPPRQPAALAAAILDVLWHPQRAAALARFAARRAERYFTAAHMVDGTLNVYRQIACGRLRQAA